MSCRGADWKLGTGFFDALLGFVAERVPLQWRLGLLRALLFLHSGLTLARDSGDFARAVFRWIFIPCV